VKSQTGAREGAVSAMQAMTGGVLPELFALLFGLFMGLCLLKFGNPAVMEKFATMPGNGYEWIFSPWPASVGCWMLGGVAAAGLLVARWRNDLPWVIVALPLVWLGWQFLAATGSINPALTRATLRHFTACAVCFYLGVFALGRVRDPGTFLLGLVAGFVLVLVEGFEQRFGGLAETRKYFFLYLYPQMKEVTPEYLKKISSDRIFGTLFYPNALAGVILMLLPATLGWVWSLQRRFTAGARGLLVALPGLGALACLYWSGSKGGWLLMLAIGFVGTLFLPFDRRLKIGVVTVVLILGLTGFVWKYSGFFKRGATSVVARFDYWQAAIQTASSHPMFGTGPGTFGTAYAKIKQPEWEMARMAHDDYLEQASDSGLAGFFAYTGLIAGGLAFTGRRGRLREDWVRLGVWLGLLGWALQSLVEFGLYIPALAWPGFALLGWLVGTSSSLDRSATDGGVPNRVDRDAKGR
jgi:O-antigen ligase